MSVAGVSPVRRRSYRSSAESTGRALDVLVESLRESHGVIDLLPDTETVLSLCAQRGEPVPRTTLYRAYPNRPSLIKAVVGRAIARDLYSTEAMREQAEGELAGLTDREGAPADRRTTVIHALGNMLVTVPDYGLVSSIKGAVNSIATWDAGNTELAEALTEAHTDLATTVASIYRGAHEELGDTLQPGATYEHYAMGAVTLAGGIALSPYRDDVPVEWQQEQFVNLANRYTQSAKA